MFLLCISEPQSIAAPCRKKPKYDVVSLQSAVTGFNLSYQAAVTALKDQIEITELSVNFKIESSRKAGGSLKVLIFKAGGEVEFTKSSSVTFNFAKPVPDNRIAFKNKDGDELADAIIRSAREFIALKDLPQPLEKDNFEIELTVGITKTINGGVETTVFKILDVDASGEASTLAEHTITMKFTIKKK